MSRTLKKVISILLVVVVLFAAAPLSGFVGLKLYSFSTIFSAKAVSADACKSESVEFGKEYQVCLLDKEISISGSFSYSGNDSPSGIKLSFSCDDSSAFDFYTPESRITDTANKTEIFSLLLLAKKEGTFVITVTTSDGFSDNLTISVVDNSYDQYVASTLINLKNSSIQNTNLLYNYTFSEKLDTTDFISSFIVNEDSRFTPEYYYELVLLDLLLSQSKNQNYLDSVKQNIERTRDTIIDYAVRYNTNYSKEQLSEVRYSDLNTAEILDYQKAFEDATSISHIWEDVNSLANGIETVEDYFDLLAKYSELENINEYYIKVLEDLGLVLSYEISETVTTNEYYFLEAVNKISAAFYDSNIVVADCLSKSADDVIWDLVKNVASGVLEKIFGSASEIIEITYETGLLVSNSAFALSDIVVAECTIKAVNFIEYYLKGTLEIEASQYNAKQNDEYAKRFNSAYLLLLSCFEYGNKVHSYYSSLLYNDSFFAKVGTLFNKNSKVLYNEIYDCINKGNEIIEEEYEYFSSITEQYKSEYYGTKQKWAVTLIYNAGISFNSTQYFFDGEEILLTGINPKRNGYDFAGWYYDSECTNEFVEGIIADDNITIYAKWIANALISTDSINEVECRLTGIVPKRTRTLSTVGEAEFVIPAYMDGYILTTIAANAIPEYVSSVFVPNTVTSIADSAIGKNTVIYGEADSYAEQYAENGGYEFEVTTIMDDNKNPTGVCGDNLNWELDRDFGVLKIYGQGEMYDYSVSPWAEYSDYIISVEFGDGVTSIGKKTFYNLSKLKSVTISDKISEIAEYAFYNCIGLESVTIGKKVSYIGNYAFGNCTNLIEINYNAENLQLSESSYSLFENAGTKNVGVKVIISEGVETIPVNLFWSHAKYQGDYDTPPNLVYVSVGENVNFIGDGAFARCSNLNQVDFTGNKLETIDEEAFAGCSLSEINLPVGLKTIRWGAFSSCPISNLIIPDSVTSIESAAFDCETLKSIDTGDGLLYLDAFNFKNSTQLEEIIVGNSVLEIPEEMFVNASFLKKVVLGNQIKQIGSRSFSGCVSLTEIVAPDSVQIIDEQAFFDCNNLTFVSLGTNITKINDEAFKNCKISSILLPNSLTTIGKGCFENCQIESIKIPQEVTCVSEKAFKGCDALRSVSFSINTTEIGKEAFNGCISLSTITIPDSVIEIGEKAFYNCGISGSVTIPQNVTYIGEYAFTGNNIDKVLYNATKCYASEYDKYLDPDSPDFEDAVAVHNSFSVFPSCSEIVFGDNVVFIPTSLLANNQNINTITLPKNLTRIQPCAFSRCENLATIRFFDGVVSIGWYAFDECVNLTDIFYSGTQTQWDSISIGTNNAWLYYANFHCASSPTTGETELEGECGDEGDNIKWLLNKDTGVLTIYGTGKMEDYWGSYETPWYDNALEIKEIKINEGVTYISDEAFNACVNAEAITIPKSIVSFGYYPFSAGLVSVYYLGSLSDWCNINFNYEWENPMASAEKLYIDGELVTSLIVPNDIDEIGNYTFYSCDSLKNVMILDHVTSIGSQAFYGCENLLSVSIGKNVKSILSKSFADCVNLKEIIISNEASLVAGKDSFNNTAYYNEQNNWEYGVLYIGTLLVDTNNNFTSSNYIIKSGTKSIACKAFDSCNILESITLPEGLEHIGDYAFANCDNIIKVELPDSMKTIGVGSFSSCDNLEILNIPNNVESIGGNGLGESFVSGTKIYNELKENSKGTNILSDGCMIRYLSNEETIVISDEVRLIADFSFIYLDNVNSVTISENVEYIGRCAFWTCDNLKSIVIPQNVKEIDDYAFGYSDNNFSRDVGGIRMNKIPNFTIYCYANSAGLEYAIENGFNYVIISSVTDKKFGVEMVYSPKNYSGEININVEKSVDAKAFQLIESKTNAKQSLIYDITMTIDGIESQLKEKVLVKIPLDKDYNSQKTFVYYVDTVNGTVKKMTSKCIDGYIVFETDHFSNYAIVEEFDIVISITNPSITTISFGDAIILHADVTGTLPEGATIKWESSNGNFGMEVSADGTTCKITPSSSGDTTFTVSVVDANGNVISSDEQVMTSNAGFFDKIIAFFKKLFGLTKTIPQVYKGIF